MTTRCAPSGSLPPKISDSIIEGVQAAGDKRAADIAGIASAMTEAQDAPVAETATLSASALAYDPDLAEEDVDLEQVLGGGIRKAPGAVTAADEEPAEVAESL